MSTWAKDVQWGGHVTEKQEKTAWGKKKQNKITEQGRDERIQMSPEKQRIFLWGTSC